jgi:hypothetical protein
MDKAKDVIAHRVEDYDHAKNPGDFFLTPSPLEGDGVRRLSFICPCGGDHLTGIRVLPGPYDDNAKKKHCWGWDGNEEQPTTEPSIAIGFPGQKGGQCWHGYLKAGVFKSC